MTTSKKKQAKRSEKGNDAQRDGGLVLVTYAFSLALAGVTTLKGLLHQLGHMRNSRIWVAEMACDRETSTFANHATNGDVARVSGSVMASVPAHAQRRDLRLSA